MQAKQKYLDDVREVLDTSARVHATTFNPEYCFDSIIDEGDVRIAVKASITIDNVESHIREELMKICSILRCTPLIVGERTRKRPLQDGVVHLRGSIPAISLETFRRMLEEKVYPFLLAKKGGIYVIMDGEKLKIAREALNLSRGDIADEMGLSRRAIYEYERGSISPKVDIALRLEELLNTSLIEPMNLFGTISSSSSSQQGEELFAKQTRLTKQTLEILSRLGFNSTIAHDAPFDLLTSLRQHVVLSYLEQRLERLDEDRLEFLAELAQVLKEEPAIIASDSPTVEAISGIPVIYLKELISLENPSDFIMLIHSRRGA
ncbi:MAG: helix-turn-helix domain-containing protein [Promethearchaeota archaeon]